MGREAADGRIIAGMPAQEFVRRRRQLMRMTGRDAVTVVPAARERLRNNDVHHAFRQDSDFHYLTGFGEPEAVLVLAPGRAHGECILFCRERDADRELWDGRRAGPEGACRDFGMDDAFPIDDIDEILPGLLEGREKIYYHFGRDSEFDLRLMSWVNRVRDQTRQGGSSPQEFLALGHVLHDLRLFKSRAEVRLMARAAKISAAAHVRAMRACRPGMREYQVEAELLHEFRRQGAVPAYESIVGGGVNACVLHYRDNSDVLADGDLLLIDAGAEHQCYASDITRTFPVNGRFSPAQRALYEVVLKAQHAAIAAVRPGASWIAPHQAATRATTAGLIRLGILKGGLEKNLREESYRRYFMHKTGHWIGLDVHDVGDYRVDGEFRLLEPGMVMTIEPGLYIGAGDKSVDKRFRGIGIRIEDDVVVTRDGHRVLSDGVPKDPDEIEAVMAGG
ncbi:MAG TPA: Xaa-Pro aminopeptidase [Xanthomonadaceae bacterium]|nr:Xaa-Pro aminopeptidase [Xanthomonadaceae bacterium]